MRYWGDLMDGEKYFLCQVSQHFDFNEDDSGYRKFVIKAYDHEKNLIEEIHGDLNDMKRIKKNREEMDKLAIENLENYDWYKNAHVVSNDELEKILGDGYHYIIDDKKEKNVAFSSELMQANIIKNDDGAIIAFKCIHKCRKGDGHETVITFIKKEDGFVLMENPTCDSSMSMSGVNNNSYREAVDFMNRLANGEIVNAYDKYMNTYRLVGVDSSDAL